MQMHLGLRVYCVVYTIVIAMKLQVGLLCFIIRHNLILFFCLECIQFRILNSMVGDFIITNNFVWSEKQSLFEW